MDFGAKKTTREKEGHYLIIKGWIYQEDIGTLNVYTSNHRTMEYLKQKIIALNGE